MTNPSICFQLSSSGWRRVEMRMLRRMSGHTRKDMIHNDHIREDIRVAPIEEKLMEKSVKVILVWTCKKTYGATLRWVYNMVLSLVKRCRGRPKRALETVVKNDLIVNNIPHNLVFDWAQWCLRRVVHNADLT